MLKPSPYFFLPDAVTDADDLDESKLAVMSSDPYTFDYGVGDEIDVETPFGDEVTGVVLGFEHRHSSVMFFEVEDTGTYGLLDLQKPGDRDKISSDV